MGFRFRRRVRLIPGLSMNLSRSGPSLSFGAKGAHLTQGHGHIRRTVGLPGTGMYWTTVSGGGKRQTHRVAQRGVRRAPPAQYRPPATAAENRQALIGCLWIIGVLVAVGLAVITFGVALIPIGLGIWWWVHHHRQQPGYRGRLLVKEALGTSDRPAAVHLLHNAIDADPSGPATLLSCGSWFLANDCFSDAADCYAAYLHLVSDAQIRFDMARALIGAGHLDEAISELEQLRSAGQPAPDPARVLAQLALAFVLKGDPGQALEIIDTATLQKHQLDPGLQLCLGMRASCRYLTGQKARAIADLERLYAQNPAFPKVLELKQQMIDGTFVLAKPAPSPDWYPPEVEVRIGPEVDEVPDDHPASIQQGTRSPDGEWTWDGSRWIASEATSQSQAPPQTATAFDGSRSDVAIPVASETPSEGALPVAPTLDAPDRMPPEPERLKLGPTNLSNPAVGQLSTNGTAWWDGTSWKTTSSPDGSWRWDGTAWVKKS